MEDKNNGFGLNCPHCDGTCNKIAGRSLEEKKLLSNRLHRVIGQLNSIDRMIQEDDYPPKVLTQVAAAAAALNSFNKEIIADFISTCITAHQKIDDTEVLDDLMTTLKSLLR